MSQAIFAPASPPRWHQYADIGHYGKWYTWSTEVRRLFRIHHGELSTLGLSRLNVKSYEPYPTTYTVRRSVLSTGLQEDIQLMAISLLCDGIGSRIRLLRGLYNATVTPLLALRFLTLVRDAIVTQQKDPRAALVSPASPTRQDSGFPLHMDLFRSANIFLIFNQVPNDGTGSSIFVPYRQFLTAIRTTPSLPELYSRKVLQFVRGRYHHTRYNKLFEFLHEPQYAWHHDLAEKLDQHTVRLAFHPGEGYVIQDRKWLHGRHASSIPVTTHRFYRLIYG